MLFSQQNEHAISIFQENTCNFLCSLQIAINKEDDKKLGLKSRNLNDSLCLGALYLPVMLFLHMQCTRVFNLQCRGVFNL